MDGSKRSLDPIELIVKKRPVSRTERITESIRFTVNDSAFVKLKERYCSVTVLNRFLQLSFHADLFACPQLRQLVSAILSELKSQKWTDSTWRGLSC